MKKNILIFCVGLILLGFASSASAYEIQTIEDTPVNGDFVLGPGKMDIVLDPGGSTTKQISVTNRTGEERKFEVEVQDFSGSHNEEQTYVLLGEVKGKYSLKDYVQPEVYEFSLAHGQRIIFPVDIEIPEDSEPGGLYASVLVSILPTDSEINNNEGKTQLVSRLGTLMFVKVNGEVNEEGSLQSFSLYKSEKNFYEKGPISFEIMFENKGNVHITPSGKIEIVNLLGRKVGEITVDSYFAMPDSLRRRVVEWDRENMFGLYTANLVLDKNYQTKTSDPETMSLSFWVIPWKIIIVLLVSLASIVFILKKVLGGFKLEIKRK